MQACNPVPGQLCTYTGFSRHRRQGFTSFGDICKAVAASGNPDTTGVCPGPTDPSWYHGQCRATFCLPIPQWLLKLPPKLTTAGLKGPTKSPTAVPSALPPAHNLPQHLQYLPQHLHIPHAVLAPDDTPNVSPFLLSPIAAKCFLGRFETTTRKVLRNLEILELMTFVVELWSWGGAGGTINRPTSHEGYGRQQGNE